MILCAVLCIGAHLLLVGSLCPSLNTPRKYTVQLLDVIDLRSRNEKIPQIKLMQVLVFLKFSSELSVPLAFGDGGGAGNCFIIYIYIYIFKDTNGTKCESTF